jgi:pyridoxine/pyridoxamine 5'-phosphate oxidase
LDLPGVFAYLATKRLAVLATIHPRGAPEAALIGFALTPDRRLVFDTSQTSRKSLNLRTRPEIALVIGWDDEITVQLAGSAHSPAGAERMAAKQAYFTA